MLLSGLIDKSGRDVLMTYFQEFQDSLTVEEISFAEVSEKLLEPSSWFDLLT